MQKILIIGGHLTPALATIEELKKEKVELIFYGRKFTTEGSNQISAEYTSIKTLNIKFRNLIAGRIQRKITKHTLFALFKIPLGFIQSFVYLLIDRPTLIVSFGGYLSTPAIFSAWLLGISSITHEQSSIPGLANKINSIFVDKIFLAWASCAQYFPKEKTEIIGNPIRKSITKNKITNIKLNKFISTPEKLIYVTGGNQGSHFINNLIFQSQRLLNDYKIIHQVGTVNFAGDHNKAKSIKSKNYYWVDFIRSEDLGAVLSNAKLVISRSGANTVWEIGTLAKVAILIPLPSSAGGEQLNNAQILENAHTSIILEQDNLNAKILSEQINKIFQNYNKFKNSSLEFQKTLPTDATKKLVQTIQNYR